MREEEQRRAEQDRIKALQEKLGAQTQFSGGGFGIASLRGLARGRRGLTSLLGSG